MARFAVWLAPLSLLLTNACTITIHGEAPASPENVAWAPPPRVVVAEPAPAPVVVNPAVVPIRTALPAVRDDGRRVVVQRTPEPRPVRAGTPVPRPADRAGTPVDAALARQRLLALQAARQEAADRRALARSDQLAAMVERERNRQAQQTVQFNESSPAR